MFSQKDKVLIFIISFLTIFLFSQISFVQAAEKCSEPATVTVIIKDADHDFLPDASFQIYEQTKDVNGDKTIGQVIGSGKINNNTGKATIKVYPYQGVNNYILKVNNPSHLQNNFWFFDALQLDCGTETAIVRSLSAIKVMVLDSQDQPEKNIKFSVYAQDRDAEQKPILGKQLGGFNTGDEGEKLIYLPAPENSVKTLPEYTEEYVLNFKNKYNKNFYKYNVSTVPGQTNIINYRFGGIYVFLQDYNTKEVIPNAKVILYQQIIDPYGDYQPGRSLASIKTDNIGKAYLEYPAGTYLLQYKHADGQVTNFSNVVIEDQRKISKTLLVKKKSRDQGKCKLRSNLKLSFRDSFGKSIPNLKAELFEQKLDNDQRPIYGGRVGSGNIDQDGVGSISFNPVPSNRYILKVCHKINKFGCFEFSNLEFDCQSDLFLEKELSEVNIVLRDSNYKFKIGTSFKIYPRVKDADGRDIIDKSRGYGRFKLPESGKLTLYLAEKDLKDNPLHYVLVVEVNPKFQLTTNFDIDPCLKTDLEYIIQPDKLVRIKPKEDPIVKTVLGKILLQVEKNGEGWYVNPANHKRYYLGRPRDAFNIMRKLSYGITNTNLAKIYPGLDVLPAGADSDNDGLVDILEQGLLLDENKADTDNDGYSDFEELRNGYNPKGSGKLKYNSRFSKQQSGKIFLQVEADGEAWYVYPNNLRRYYLGRPQDAFNIMRSLGLGITNNDLQKIPICRTNL